jgi:spore maturation protein CgeB
MKVLIVDNTIYSGKPLLSFVPRRGTAQVTYFDEAPYLKPLHTSLAHKVVYRALGRRPATAWALNRRLLEAASDCRPDVVIVAKGAYVFPTTLRNLRVLGARLVNYATDDPFNNRSADGWLRSSIREYDLYACTKRVIESDVRTAGCKRTAFVRFAYDPELHFPDHPRTSDEVNEFASDVVFVGGADADRLPYMDALLSIPGLKLALYGGFWDRQPRRYRRLARGIVTGRRYRLALTSAKIALGLYREANRDQHSMRTFEIPACGAFLCAPRSAEHEELFREGTDAAFFGSPDELKSQVTRYLDDDDARTRIAAAGFRAVTQGAHTYADRIVEMAALATE